MAFSKKRSYSSAFKKKGKKGFKKKRWSPAKRTPLYRAPSQIVKSHALTTTPNVSGQPLVATIRLSEIFNAAAFTRAKLLHERVVILSMGVQFSVKTTSPHIEPAFALTMISRDDESEVVDELTYLRHNSVLKHDLTKGTCSRTMSGRDLGHIAFAPMICNQLQYVQHNANGAMGSLNGNSASLKIIIPTAQMAATSAAYGLTCYVTYTAKFLGQQDTLTATEQLALSSTF